MKTKGMMRSINAKKNKVNRIMKNIQKDMDAIFKIENPTKEQMKEAVLLFGAMARYKKIYNELDSIYGSLLMLNTYNVEDL